MKGLCLFHDIHKLLHISLDMQPTLFWSNIMLYLLFIVKALQLYAALCPNNIY